MSISLKTAGSIELSFAKTNKVYLHPEQAKILESAPGKTFAPSKTLVCIKQYIFVFEYVNILKSTRI